MTILFVFGWSWIPFSHITSLFLEFISSHPSNASFLIYKKHPSSPRIPTYSNNKHDGMDHMHCDFSDNTLNAYDFGYPIQTPSSCHKGNLYESDQ